MCEKNLIGTADLNKSIQQTQKAKNVSVQKKKLESDSDGLISIRMAKIPFAFISERRAADK